MQYACVFFFFQAEDGIRDATVTGVQTCALPISPGRGRRLPQRRLGGDAARGLPQGGHAREEPRPCDHRLHHCQPGLHPVLPAEHERRRAAHERRRPRLQPHGPPRDPGPAAGRRAHRGLNLLIGGRASAGRGANLLLAAASLAVFGIGLAAAEWMARRLNPRYLERISLDDLAYLHTYSPVYGWTPRPSFRYTLAGSETTINRLGYRGRAVTAART